MKANCIKGGSTLQITIPLFQATQMLHKRRSELEWTIIFGLNFTKIYGGHMSSADFLWKTHVLHRFLQRTCVHHRFSVSGTNFLCLESVEDMCPPQKICGGHVSSIDFDAIQTKNNGPF